MKRIKILALVLAMIMLAGTLTSCLDTRSRKKKNEQDLEPTYTLIVNLCVKDAAGAEVYKEKEYIYIYTASMFAETTLLPTPFDILKDYCKWELSSTDETVEAILSSEGMLESIGDLEPGTYTHPVLNKTYNTFWTWSVNGKEVEQGIDEYTDIKDYDTLEFALVYEMSAADKEALKNTTKKPVVTTPSGDFEGEDDE